MGHTISAQPLEMLEMEVSHVEVSPAYEMDTWSVVYTSRLRNFSIW